MTQQRTDDWSSLSSSMIVVRHGESGDIGSCVELAQKFWEETDYSHIEFIPTCTAQRFALCMEHGLFSVVERDGRIIGTTAGLTSPLLCNSYVKVGAELIWYVYPEERRGSVGIKLLRHIEQSARDVGCRLWSMMALEAVNPELAEKLYLREGYAKMERTYVKEL